MTIMASLAQQESESLSANVRLGLQFRYQQGKVLEENTADRIAAIDEQIKTLQHELLATAGIKNSGDELGMEIRRLRDEKQTIQTEEASRKDLKTRIDELISFLDDLSCELTEYDEQYVRTLLDNGLR